MSEWFESAYAQAGAVGAIALAVLGGIAKALGYLDKASASGKNLWRRFRGGGEDGAAAPDPHGPDLNGALDQIERLRSKSALNDEDRSKLDELERHYSRALIRQLEAEAPASLDALDDQERRAA